MAVTSEHFNLAAYAFRLLERVPQAVRLPWRPGELETWKASEHQCHSNVAYWCRHNPGDSVVPGWLYFSYGGYMPYVRFTAHSVVRLLSGELRDITPSQASMPYPFIAAEDSPSEYAQLVEHHQIMHLDLYISEGRVEALGLDNG